mmetsp:Transcript_5086/g.13221  ORF Transcript_5086/g.13221 Transcript_5086/m.13221 type:complete len:243 (-) Transcript_5086:204-932(-)
MMEPRRSDGLVGDIGVGTASCDVGGLRMLSPTSRPVAHPDDESDSDSEISCSQSSEVGSSSMVVTVAVAVAALRRSVPEADPPSMVFLAPAAMTAVRGSPSESPSAAVGGSRPVPPPRKPAFIRLAPVFCSFVTRSGRLPLSRTVTLTSMTALLGHGTPGLATDIGRHQFARQAVVPQSAVSGKCSRALGRSPLSCHVSVKRLHGQSAAAAPPKTAAADRGRGSVPELQVPTVVSSAVRVPS